MRCCPTYGSPNRGSGLSTAFVTVPGMEYTQECDGLAAAVDSFANAIEGADLSTPVPTCPEWTLRDLVTHMGQIHRWVDGIVRERLQERRVHRAIALATVRARSRRPTGGSGPCA